MVDMEVDLKEALLLVETEEVVSMMAIMVETQGSSAVVEPWEIDSMMVDMVQELMDTMVVMHHTG